MSDAVEQARHDVWLHARRMWEAGLVVASAGNVSRRIDAERIAITPASLAYDVMTADDVAVVELATGAHVDGLRPPSSELPMHLVLYRERDDVAAIVHTHSPLVTTLSVLQRSLPPVIDEMMLYFG
jgi:L-fuculose-phosphate aldolase